MGTHCIIGYHITKIIVILKESYRRNHLNYMLLYWMTFSFAICGRHLRFLRWLWLLMIIYHLFISFHVAYLYYHLTMLAFTLFMLRVIVYKELTLTKLQRHYCYFYSNARQTYFKQAVKNWRNLNVSKYCRYLSHMIVIKIVTSYENVHYRT